MSSLERLLRALVDGNVEFIIVGGLAATVHGAARLTFDIDLVYRRSSENIHALVEALGPLKPYLRGAPPGLPLKRAAGRPRDLDALAELKALLEESDQSGE